MLSSKTSEKIAPLAVTGLVAGGGTNATTTTSLYTLSGGFARHYAVGSVITGAATGVITVSIVCASDTSGTGATAVVSATATSTAIALLPLSVDFDINGAGYLSAKPYVAVLISATGTSTGMAAVLFGDSGRVQPVTGQTGTVIASV